MIPPHSDFIFSLPLILFLSQVFVEDAESKMRTMSSAITDNSLANEEKEKKEGAFRPKFKSEAELPGDESN